MTGLSLRPPQQVMRLSRLGSAHQTRLSFMRVVLRGLRRGGWQITRPLWKIDAQGVGRATYRVAGQGQVYSLVAFAHDLPPEQRSDRVIAEAWDATFALVDGEVSEDDLNRLADNVPLQEAGRVSDRELVLSRANRSVRLWDHVVERLASGTQPDPAVMAEVGYLMRTTAVYGSGKFGAADHAALSGRALMDGPFRAEMLAVWLIRAFVRDLVEHMARTRGGSAAVPLARDLAESLGIGNSTGLGMAPFLVNHPALLDAWITARETAVARVCAQEASTPETRAGFGAAFDGACANVAGWHSAHPLQVAKLDALREDCARLSAYLRTNDPLGAAQPWAALYSWSQRHLSVEGQELVAALMLEPHGGLIDDLAETMGVDEMARHCFDGAARLDKVQRDLRAQYDWALDLDLEQPDAQARFWYVSAAKQEPRLGRRAQEPGAELEQPLDIARAAQALGRALSVADLTQCVADFVMTHPEHRRMLRRLHLNRDAPYSEIRDNLLDDAILPLNMLRLKLAFFGATRFDPRSDRWLRITMYQGAPYPDDLHDGAEDAWVLHGGAAPSRAGQVAAE